MSHDYDSNDYCDGGDDHHGSGGWDWGSHSHHESHGYSHGHSCDDPDEPYSWFEGSTREGDTHNHNFYYFGGGGANRGRKYSSGTGCVLPILFFAIVATIVIATLSSSATNIFAKTFLTKNAVAHGGSSR